MTIVGVVGDVRQASHRCRGRDRSVHAAAAASVCRERSADRRARAVRPARRRSRSRAQKIVRTANAEVAMKLLTLDESVGRSIAAPRPRATLVVHVRAARAAAGDRRRLRGDQLHDGTAHARVRAACRDRQRAPRDILRLVLGGAGGLALTGITARTGARR